MNKISPAEVIIASRLPTRQQQASEGIEDSPTSRENEAKYTLLRLPENYMMTIEPRYLKLPKQDISFNKLSDWYGRNVPYIHPNRMFQTTSVFSASGSRKGARSLHQPYFKADMRTTIYIVPHSARSARSHRYTLHPTRKSIEISTNLMVQDEDSRRKIQRMTNSDLDELIKYVMQSQYSGIARIPAVNMSRNFNTTPSSYRRAGASSTMSKRINGTSTTIDNPYLRTSIGSSFPVRRHRRSRSGNNSKKGEATTLSSTIQDYIDFKYMRKALLRYNNTGLYRDKVRGSTSTNRPMFKKQTPTIESGIVGLKINACR